MAIKMAPIRVSTRTRNIAKSFGYAAIDAAKELNPTLTRIHNDTKSMMSDVKTSMRNMSRDSVSQAAKDLTDPRGQNVVNNLIEDFKSGNWYNKDRDASGFFDDDNWDLGEEDWGDDEQSSSEKSASSAMSSSLEGMKNLSGSIAVSMGKSSAASAEYIAKSSRIESQAIYSLTKTGFNNISTILLNIDNKMDVMMQMQQPLVVQAQNTYVFQARASEFFDSTTDKLNTISASLEQIAANTGVLNASAGGRRYKDKGLSSLIFGDEFSVSSYFDLVRDNIKEQTEMYKGILDLSTMAFGKNGKNVSPIGMAMVSAMKLMTPTVLKESMSNFNAVVEGAIPALIQSLRKDTKNAGALGQILRDILLPDVKTKVRIDTGNYNKGPVAWDGVARKSLVEVIPTYLAKIYASLGGEEKYFDYGSGKFVSMNDIRKYQRDRRESLAKQSGGKFREDLLSAAGNDAKLAKEIESYFDKALDVGHNSGKLRRANAEDVKYLKKEMGLSDSSIALINQVISGYQRDHDTAKLMKYTLGLVSAQGSLASQIKREEEKGYSVENYAANNFAESKDKWNMTQSEYMHGMYQMVGNIYAILGGGQFKGTTLFNTNNGSVTDISKITAPSSNKSVSDFGEDVHIGKSEKEFEKEKRAKEAKERVKSAKSGFAQQMSAVAKNMKDLRDYQKNPEKYKNRKLKEFNQAMGNENDLAWYEKPFAAMADAINNLSDGIVDLFWGEHEGETLFDTLRNKITDSFNSLKTRIFEGIKNSSLFQAMKEEFGNIRNNVKEGFGNFRDSAIRAYNDRRMARKYAADTEPIDKAARGRRVTRTGLVAVSEGELIIPSEYNPFYHGITNKAKQIRDEDRIARGYLGSFAKGGTVGGKVGEIAGSSAEYVVGGFTHFFQTVFKDTTDPKEIDKAKKSVNDNISKIFKDAGYSKGAMGIGAVAGAGVGLLTGSVLGPIVGGAVGAGIGLLSKSETLQKVVFGEIGEDGVDNRTIIGKAKDAIINKVNEALKSKKLPAVAGGAALGAVTGLIGGPFGIVGGALIGSAAGFVTTTEEFKNFMFGDGSGGEDDDSFTGLLRNKVIHNLDDIFHNTWNMLEGIGNRLWYRLSRGLRTINNRFNAWLTKKKDDGSLLGKILGVGEGALKLPVRAVGGVLTAVNRGTKRFNLRHGFNVYDRELGRNMTAAERDEARETYRVRNNMYGNFDEMLAGTAYSDLDEVSNQLKALQDPKNLRREMVNSNMKDMYKSLEESGLDLTGKDRAKIDALIRAGKSDKAIEWLKSNNAMQNASESDVAKILGGAASSNMNAGSAEAQSKYEKDLLKKLGLPSKDVDLQTALALVNSEKSIRESLGEGEKEEELKAQQIEKDDTDYKVSILNLLSSVNSSTNNIIAAITDAKAGNNKLVGAIKGKWAGLVAKHAEVTNLKNTLKGEESNSSGGAGLANDDGTISVPDSTTGGMIKMSKDSQGDYNPVTNDSATDETMKKKNKFLDSINSIPGIGTAIGGIGGMFSLLKDKLFGNEEKKGIFDILQEKLFGEEGFLSGIFNWFTGGTGGSVKSILSGGIAKTIGTILMDGLVIAGVGAAFGGLFNDFANKVTGGAYGDNDNGNRDGEHSTTATTKDGINVHKDASGNWVDSSGNIYSDGDISISTISSKRADVDSFSTKFTKNFIRGTLTGSGSVAGLALSKTAAGKAVKSVTDIAKGGLDDIAKNGVEAAGYIATDSVLEITTKIGTGLKKIPFLKNVDIDGMMTKLGSKIAGSLDSGALKKFADAAGTALVVLKVALIVADFTTGYQDARTTLGITDEPTFGQRVFSGLLRVLKNLIPFVGTLIPDSLIVDVVLEYLCPALGISAEELQGQRAAADEEVAAYNEEHGTDLTKEEYIKQVMGDYTWTEKIGNAAKEKWTKVKTGVSGTIQNIKEKGLGNTIKEGVSGIATSIKESKVGQGVSNIVNKIKTSYDTFKKELTEGYDIWKSGRSFKEIFDFSEYDDSENPLGGLMKGVLLITRLNGAGIALFSNIGNKIKERFIDIKDKIVGGVKNISSNVIAIKDLADKGDVRGVLTYEPEATDEDNPLGGFQTAAITVNKFANVIPAGLHWIGNKIKEAWDEFTAPIKTDASTFISGFTAMKDAADNGDYSTVQSQTFTAGENNPLGGLFNFGFGVSKLVFTLSAFANKFGNAIKDVFGSLGEAVGEKVEEVKENVSNAVSSAKETAKNWVSDKVDAFREWSGLGSGMSGGDSGFVSQYDSRYKNKSFAGSTFGEKGCGPSVAAMTAKALGKNLSVSSAISKSSKYQNGNGVDAGYFKEALGSSGIGTSYMQGANKQQQILNALANGQKVILLGRDGSNSSKDNSPFGPKNHYVLATGYDKNGIIINDPESGSPRRYSWNILNGVKLGIGASKISKSINANAAPSGMSAMGFGNDYDANIAQQVYAFFTGRGYSPAAAAGILGNMYQESRINPSAVQGGGKGPAAGIVQWENINDPSSRYGKMKAYAESKGKGWTDLNSQLEFIDSELQTLSNAYWKGSGKAAANLTKAGATATDFATWKASSDPVMATNQFEAAFERGGKPQMETRRQAASHFYNMYSGQTFNYDPSAYSATSSESASVGTSTGSSGSSDSGFTGGFFNIISNISSLFSKAFGVLTGSNSSESTGTIGSSYANGASYDNALAGVSFSGGSPSEIMRSILGKISYSMKGPRNPEKGSADCSSTVQWAIKKAGGPDIGGNTGTQYNNANLNPIQYEGGSDISSISGNAMKDDVMFFARRGGSSDKGAALDHVGHVGLYLGNNQYIDHGSGMGPKIKDFKTDSHLIKISRVNTGLTASSSTSSRTKATGGGDVKMMAMGSGLSAGDSGLFDTIGNGGDTTSQIRAIVNANTGSKGIDPAMVNKLIGAIAEVLKNIADNTSPIEKIYQILVQSLSGGGSEQNTTQPIKPANKKIDIPSSADLDSSLIALAGTLAQLAKG